MYKKRKHRERKFIMGVSDTNQVTKESKLLLWCFALGLLYDFMFFDTTFAGIAYPIFVVAVYGVFAWLFHSQGRLKPSFTFPWLLVALILLLSLTFVLFSNPAFLVLNFFLVHLLFVAHTMLVTGTHKRPWHHIGFLIEMAERVTIHTLSNLLKPFSSVVRSRLMPSSVAIKVGLGIAITCPLLLVVIVLLSSADSIFLKYVIEIPKQLLDIDFGEIPAHIILTTFITLILFAYFWSLLHLTKESEPTGTSEEETRKPKKLDGVISVTILTMLNLVYVIFTAIQISFLFGGAESALPAGVTYSEYARQGFGEMLTVSFINIGVLLLLLHFASQQKKGLYRAVQVLLTILTVCSLFILFSAFTRLTMYEQAYGFTLLRLLPQAFMILLLSLFAVSLVRVWKSNVSLYKSYTIITLVWLVALNYANLDLIIAKSNIQRYQQTGEIDLDYIGSLSYDVVPELAKLQKDPKIGDKAVAELKKMKSRLKFETKPEWQTFNFSRHRAEQIVKNIH
ncbi:DUF4173 domain-containing protein [Laceyella tengchongensis]|nr:DUF4173 domain-containing protein [Laceyella tengchongensis]